MNEKDAGGVVKKKKDIKANSATLTSVWQSTGKDEFSNGPTVATTPPQKLNLDMESGAKIKKVEVTANVSGANTGASILSVNGNSLSTVIDKSSVTKNIAKTSLDVQKGSNSVDVQFEFKANGNTTDEPVGSSTVTIEDPVIHIEYEVSSTPAQQKSEPLMTVPPQTCCIYCDGLIYMFDGVIRIQHNLSTKVEEEPNQEKHEYINNALNEPDKITLDVMMSDVYTGGGAIEGTPTYKAEQNTVLSVGQANGIVTESSRSANAYGVLKQMKDNRQYVAVITPQYVYCDMLITSLVANQDESCPYGWTGQIVFQSRYAKIKAGYGQKASNTGTAEPTPSFVSQLGKGGKNKATAEYINNSVAMQGVALNVKDKTVGIMNAFGWGGG